MDITVVIPVYNEKDSIAPLYNELKVALERTKLSYEIIFVDDGSSDNTFEKVRTLNNQNKNVRAVQFTKNFQKAAALTAGFREAKGDVIITLDGDLQDDPNEIPKLLECIKSCDMVVGWRHDRADNAMKKLPSLVFNSLIRFAIGAKLHDSDCNLRAIKSYVVKGMSIYGGLYRYIPIIAHNMGYDVREIKVHHRKRLYGQSKYGMKRLFSGVLDLITVNFLMSYMRKPMHLFGYFGFASTTIGFLLGIYLMILKYGYNAAIANRPLLFLAVLLIVVGIQFFSIGLIGEMITSYNYSEEGQYTIKRKL